MPDSASAAPTDAAGVLAFAGRVLKGFRANQGVLLAGGEAF